MISPVKQNIAALRILFCVVLFEYVLFIFSGVSFSFLTGDRFFIFGVDPAAWLVYIINIPQFITQHHRMGLLLDGLVLFLLLVFIFDPLKHRVAQILFLLLFLFYITLTGYLTHRNYQVGFFMVFFPFIFKKDINKSIAFEAIRYFILLFYVTAAILKLSGKSIFVPEHFSHMLSSQFSLYFLEGNTSLRTNLNLYLVEHPYAAYSLYIGSFLIELSAMIGFFTKRFDKWIAILLIVFHFMSWLIMDIAPFGQIGFLSLLFFSKLFKLSGTAINTNPVDYHNN